MGISLFGVDIAAIINSKMGGGLPEYTLVKITQGERDSQNLGGGRNFVETEYTCKGITEDFKNYEIDGVTVRSCDRMIMILGDSLTSGIVPRPGDRIIVESTEFTIIRVNRDPAAAQYSCHSRGPEE